MAMKNRFHTVMVREEAATPRYERFIDANNEAASVTLPEIRCVKRSQHRSDPQISKAMEKVEVASKIFQQDRTQQRRMH